MKAFIVYASAGAGHQKAAEALYEYLKDTRRDLELRLINILDYTSAPFKLLYSKGYIFLISRLPWLWYILYRSSFFFSDNPFHFRFDYINSLPFVDLLRNERPDVVISTHFLTSSVITVFKKQEPSYNFRNISIVTDYNLHPFWVGQGVDLYITSCDYVKEELLKRGVALEKIKAYGIPARDRFYSTSDRNDTAQKLGVDPGKFTVLIITGAIGIGPIEQIVRALADDAQLLVVCGKNKGLYNRIIEMRHDQVKPFPLINNVDELMSVSDLVLTKAGGLTITEALAKNLPIIFFASVPGLETSNAEVINKYGVSFIANSVTRIKKAVLLLKNTPEAYKKMRKNLNLISKKNTLQDISSQIPLSSSG